MSYFSEREIVVSGIGEDTIDRSLRRSAIAVLLWAAIAVSEKGRSQYASVMNGWIGFKFHSNQLLN
jgi:hypothetical protein